MRAHRPIESASNVQADAWRKRDSDLAGARQPIGGDVPGRIAAGLLLFLVRFRLRSRS